MLTVYPGEREGVNGRSGERRPDIKEGGRPVDPSEVQRHRRTRPPGPGDLVAIALTLALLTGALGSPGTPMRPAGARAPADAGAKVRLPPPVPCPSCWRPPLRTSWQIQLDGAIDAAVRVGMIEVDLFDTPASTVAALHARGMRVLCYLDAGTWERWRPDASRFPASVLGRPDAGWSGERWLDVRRLGALAPIMRSRLERCRSKGFDGVDLDNVDGYANPTGFPLTATDQLRYDTWLANEAHRLLLVAALKNDPGQVPGLLPYFDMALDEQCFQYGTCRRLLPFVRAGKPVFDIEYALPLSAFCPRADALGLNAIRKRLALGAWRAPCP